MKKKLLSVVLCGVMAAALLAGCGKKIGKDRAANNKNWCGIKKVDSLFSRIP
ncbi:hypothetical protein [Claveliimonas bilis]|uniref:Uncharacterized protein n=1 Tax=Claveliimonas bilis TaxID=3028070 RepID=A0ABM8I4Q6_9FIRM|nr:hypothetical protein [Claveliimonas bilis]BDZ77240.1 hypothetical protein Lac1_14230 [Claveliimonas bilis]BDZ78837.1 hypothetical protein Lac3_00460 [Claveliimonas bilis]